MEAEKKEGLYSRVYEQLKDLLVKTGNPYSRMATINAILYHKFNYFFWCGFYLLEEGALLVGPYQGELACQVLEKDKGVCWSGINKRTIIIVADVHDFPGHIACDSRSRSEIVVPIVDKKGEIAGVLDVDSKNLNAFDSADARWLDKIAGLIYG